MNECDCQNNACDSCVMDAHGKTRDIIGDTNGKSRSPLDHGHAWLIAAAAGFTFFIGTGFMKSYTMFYEQLLWKFERSATSTAFVGSIHSGVKMCSSPIVSALVNLFGTRRVTIAGGIISFVGFTMSSFPPSLYYMYLSHGVIAAIGTNMVHCSAFIMVGQYFDKRRGIAMGLVTSCTGLGVVVFAPVFNYLFFEYGYSGTMLIYAGITLHYVAVGLIYQPVLAKYLSDLNEEIGIHTKPKMLYRSTPSPSSLVSASVERTDLSESRQSLRHDTTLCSDIAENSEPLNSVSPSINRELTDLCEKGNISKPKQEPQGRWASINQHFGFFLLKHLDFVALLFLICGAFIAFSVEAFLLGLGKEILDLTSYDIALMLSTCSALDILTGPLSGVIFDHRIFQPIQIELWLVAASGVGLCLILVPFARSYAVFFALWAGYVVMTSVFQTQHVGIVSNLAGSRNLPSAMGLVRFMMGTGLLLGPTLGGILKDTSDSYFYSFILSGCAIVSCSGLFKITQCVRKCHHSRSTK